MLQPLKNHIKLLLSAGLTVLLFLMASQTTHAQTSCAGVTISPASGDATTVFTITATGCRVDTSVRYTALVRRDGQGVTSVANNVTGGEGQWQMNVGPFPDGAYEIWFYEEGGNPAQRATATFNVQAAPIPTDGICGQLVPVGATVNCPTTPQCPLFATSVGAAQNWCACGELGFGCCPAGNALNQAPCQNGLSCQAGVCKIKEESEEPGTGPLNYFCGEMVLPEDEANFQCNGGCQPKLLDTRGPRGERFWCSCGESLSICCPTGNNPECEGDCNMKPGLTSCATSSQSCSGNVCVTPAVLSPVFCSGQKEIFTAIGCIPVDLISRFGGFFVSWGLSIGGAIAILTLCGSAFIIMTSSGDPAKLETGKSLLVSSISGIVFLVFSMFIFRTIGINVLGLFQ